MVGCRIGIETDTQTEKEKNRIGPHISHACALYTAVSHYIHSYYMTFHNFHDIVPHISPACPVHILSCSFPHFSLSHFVAVTVQCTPSQSQHKSWCFKSKAFIESLIMCAHCTVHICVCIGFDVYMFICIYISFCIGIHVYICICTYVCICV